MAGYVKAGNIGRGRVGVRRNSPAGRGGETRGGGESGEAFSSPPPRRSGANANAYTNVNVEPSANTNAKASVNANAKAEAIANAKANDNAKTNAKTTAKSNAKIDAKSNANAKANASAKTNANEKNNANAKANANANVSNAFANANVNDAYANANVNNELSAGFRSSSEHWPETHASDDGDGPAERWVQGGGSYYSSSDAVAGGANDGELEEGKYATWGALVRSSVERSEAAFGCVERAVAPENKGRCQEQGEAWREDPEAVAGRGISPGPVEQGEAWREDSRAALGRGSSPRPVERAGWTPRSTRQAALLMRGAVRYVKWRGNARQAAPMFSAKKRRIR